MPPTPTTEHVEKLADTVARLEHEALERMTAVLEGAAACRLDGPRTQPVKHWEGRAAALAEVRRGLARGEEPPALLSRIGTRWSEQAAARNGETWRAYSTGGLEALAVLGAPVGARVSQEPA